MPLFCYICYINLMWLLDDLIYLLPIKYSENNLFHHNASYVSDFLKYLKVPYFYFSFKIALWFMSPKRTVLMSMSLIFGMAFREQLNLKQLMGTSILHLRTRSHSLYVSCISISIYGYHHHNSSKGNMMIRLCYNKIIWQNQ